MKRGTIWGILGAVILIAVIINPWLLCVPIVIGLILFSGKK
jgi:hypothetical protein